MSKQESEPLQSANSDENNEYTVAYWRKRFEQLRPDLNRNWHGQLAAFDPSLDSLKGANDMRAVSHGKASLVVTQRIVSIIEDMQTKKPKRKHRNLTVWERLELGARMSLAREENRKKKSTSS